MKRNIILMTLAFACVILSFENSEAQTVVVTPKKTVYKRPKSQADFKKSFTVIRPQVKGLNQTLAKKIETAASYEKNFDFNLKEEINEVQWLEEASYTLNYNKNGILNFVLTMIGSGAYPSESNKSIVINAKTGEKVTPQDIFTKLDELAAKGKAMQQAEINKAIVEIKKENPDEQNPEDLFQNADFKVENLNEFSVSDKGVTFWYEYGFPHVIQALQPEGRYFFSWAQLKPFIKRGGLLEKFVR